MKTIVMRSFLIALVVGVIITAVSSILTASFHQSSEVLGARRVLTGLDAIQAAIDAFGIAGYVRSLIGAFLLFFVAIFVGAFWQGRWTLRGHK